MECANTGVSKRDYAAALAAAGVVPEVFIPEYGRNQFEITQSGSYYLAGDITISPGANPCILITAADVTLVNLRPDAIAAAGGPSTSPLGPQAPLGGTLRCSHALPTRALGSRPVSCNARSANAMR